MRMPIQLLAGCLAHTQCHSGDGVDGRAHPEAGPLRLPFPISSGSLQLLLLPVSDWLLCEINESQDVKGLSFNYQFSLLDWILCQSFSSAAIG